MNEEQLRNYTESVQALIAYARANEASLSPEETAQIEAKLQEADQFFSQLKKQVAPSNDAQLLWILGGGNPEAFVNYLSQFQTPDTTSLLNNPYALKKVIGELERTNPYEGIVDQVNGVPRAQLQSSNVFGSDYDPKTQKLKVQFQGGSLYEYDSVDPTTAALFQAGAASAKTDGQNQYGKWWKNKSPTLGGALNSFIKKGGFPYRKVA